MVLLEMKIEKMMKSSKPTYEKALDDALKYLSYKSRTEVEVRTKLTRKMYIDDIICRVIERLQELNFINDYEYTKHWVTQRSKINPEGRIKIFYDLQNRGINKEEIQKAMDELEYDEYSSASVLGLKKKEKIIKAKDKKEIQSLYAYFQRKGFCYETIRAVIEAYSRD